MSKTCQLEDYGARIISNDENLFNNIFICDKKARHSIVVRENRIGSHRKKVFRLCDTHFKQLQEHSHGTMGCTCHEEHAGYLFRENRL